MEQDVEVSIGPISYERNPRRLDTQVIEITELAIEKHPDGVSRRRRSFRSLCADGTRANHEQNGYQKAACGHGPSLGSRRQYRQYTLIRSRSAKNMSGGSPVERRSI